MGRAVTVQVTIEGAEEIKAALKAIGVKAEKVLEDAVLEGAEEIRAETARRAPRKTGALAQSIEKKVTKIEPGRVTVQVGPDRKHFYGLFLEFGTQAHEITPKNKKALRLPEGIYASAEHGGIRARPFIRPAFDEKKDEAEAAVGRVLRRKLGI